MRFDPRQFNREEAEREVAASYSIPAGKYRASVISAQYGEHTTSSYSKNPNCQYEALTVEFAVFLNGGEVRNLKQMFIIWHEKESTMIGMLKRNQIIVHDLLNATKMTDQVRSFADYAMMAGKVVEVEITFDEKKDKYPNSIKAITAETSRQSQPAQQQQAPVQQQPQQQQQQAPQQMQQPPQGQFAPPMNETPFG